METQNYCLLLLHTVGFIEMIVEFLYNVLKTLEFHKKVTVFILKVCLLNQNIRSKTLMLIRRNRTSV